MMKQYSSVVVCRQRTRRQDLAAGFILLEIIVAPALLRGLFASLLQVN